MWTCLKEVCLASWLQIDLKESFKESKLTF